LQYKIVDNFLKSEECKTIIEMAKSRLTPSTSWNVKKGVSEITNYRISDQMFFTIGENYLVRCIEDRIADITGFPIENGEGLQVVHYLQGGYYKLHSDSFDLEWPGNQSILNRGGQRIITVLIYLNDLHSFGGETYFPYLDLEVEPNEGRALIWYNVYENGLRDRSTFHEARPVLRGEKWIATKWLREFKFH
jgi:prolyl 4-hydroxylase